MKIELAKLENHERVVVKVLLDNSVMPPVNFPQKVIFDILYTNEFLIRVRSRTFSISSECNTI